MKGWFHIRLVDYFTIISIGILCWTVMQGFSKASPRATVGFGLISCIFWFFASTLPVYWPRLKYNYEAISGLNSLAAASTGAAIFASVPNAWSVFLP